MLSARKHISRGAASLVVLVVALSSRAPGQILLPTSPESEAGWRVEPGAQTDLWFHAMAVIAADEPGPLGLYSADYARRIRELKQQAGVYPTALDSLGPDLRREIVGDSSLQFLHFVPLYFPRAEPDRMLRALRGVADRRNSESAGSDPGFGIEVMTQYTQRGSYRRLLRRLVETMQQEWNVFYRDYWERQRTEQEPRETEMQTMWDSLFAPQLGPYLERRRLIGGIVMPSPALGPEGRIFDPDPFNPRDQVVAMQLPLSTDSPDPSVFAFLKELCFLLIDPRILGAPPPPEAGGIEDLRRRAAVRCGEVLLEFYAPTLAGRYRRVFLDAVGAEESSTVAAFERVYPLEPDVFQRIREEIRRR